jgi:hypothetical protein
MLNGTKLMDLVPSLAQKLDWPTVWHIHEKL